MGSIRISETSQVGEVYSTVVYEFSDASDFFAWDEYKAERLNNALKSFVGGLDPMDSVNYPEEPMTGEIQVKKKNTKH